MYAELQAGVSAVRAALDLVKAGKGVLDQAAIAHALSEIQSRLMESQVAALKALEENSELQRRVRELEHVIEQRAAWTDQAAKYQLTQIAQGITAYTEASRTSKLFDAVKLCTNCFEDQRISVLQFEWAELRQHSLKCPRCKMRLLFRGFADQ